MPLCDAPHSGVPVAALGLMRDRPRFMAMRPWRHALIPLAAALGSVVAAPSSAQYDSDSYRYGYYSGAALGEQLRRERELAEWRAVAAVLSDFRRAYKRPAAESSSPGPTSWRAQNENPWANAYGTPSSSGYSPSVRTLPGSSARLCTCYLPADARSWDGGPLTPADIARRCQAQCF